MIGILHKPNLVEAGRQKGRIPVQPDPLNARIREAVAGIVGRQLAAGVDIVNDGEMSKPSYATYIKDRLNGFGGESQPPPYPDLVPFPGLHQKVYGDRGRARRGAGEPTGQCGRSFR